jgi:hypothetical protein
MRVGRYKFKLHFCLPYLKFQAIYMKRFSNNNLTLGLVAQFRANQRRNMASDEGFISRNVLLNPAI